MRLVQFKTNEVGQIDKRRVNEVLVIETWQVASSINLLALNFVTNGFFLFQNAVFLAPVVSIPILLFSGFFISLDTIPFYLKWLSYISYIRYSYQSVLLGIYSLNRPELVCDKIFCPFQEPLDFLKEMDMISGNLYVDYAALLGFFIVFRIIAYHVLYYRVIYAR